MNNECKNAIRCLFLIVCFSHSLWIHAQFDTSAFRLQAVPKQHIQIENIRITKDTILVLNIPGPVYGLSVTGKSHLTNDKGYVRILLKDNYDYEFLIYETYSLLSDSLVSSFNGVAMETISLDAITPVALLIHVDNANLELTDIQYSTSTTERSYSDTYEKLHRQKTEIVDKLNQHLKERNMPWLAGVTSFSQMSYEEKKASFGGHLPMLYGFEYYKDGVFVLPDYEASGRSRTAASPYVEEIDWRNRHGRNWLTPAKEQGDCNSCWAFSAVGTVEAYANLYFNQLLDLDLSEQELVSCSHANGCGFGYTYKALEYIKSNGLVEESCFPYVSLNGENGAECSVKCEDFKDKISIERYDTLDIPTSNEDSIKKALLKSPISIELKTWQHGVVLAGYKKVNVGDTLFTQTPEGGGYWSVASGALVGEDAWLIKNSKGKDWGRDGYGYLAFWGWIDMKGVLAVQGKVNSLIYDDPDIVCEDRDGDGYFFWGIGDKPQNLPVWAQEEPDGDDSDANAGPMDSFGYLTPIDIDSLPPIYIDRVIDWNTENFVYNHLLIESGGVLTVSAHVLRHRDSNITVKQGGTLIIDGGNLERGHIVVESGGHLVLKNGGTIQRGIEIQRGGTLEIIEGQII